ncbi:serine hydrolase domain-containing protein [Streptomyces youssoufiensis]
MGDTTGARGRGGWASRRVRLGVGLGVVVAVAAGAVATATGTAPDRSPVDRRELRRDTNAVHVAGATGVVAEVRTPDGGARARAGDGNVATRRPVPWRAHYRVGGVGRPFASVVALQLVGEGRLRLADPVERVLPGVVTGHGNDGTRITVADLLRHTSGLADYADQLPGARDLTPRAFEARRFTAYEPAELVRLAMARGPRWQPDPSAPVATKRWGYSRTNDLLVDLVIEKVTGRPVAREIHDRVIARLGLRHTFTAGTSAYLPRPAATGYTRFPGTDQLTDTSVFVPLPDTSVISTTGDVAEFFRALFDGRLLGDAERARLRETTAARDGWGGESGVRFGLGVYWRPVAGCDAGVWYHGGSSPGHVAAAGATDDGRRAVATAVTTWRPGSVQQRRQDEATSRLVDHALCDAR